MTDNLLESFQQAYRNLQLIPLLGAGELDRFGVDYGREIMDELEQLVEDSPLGNDKIIFIGHRGCGKSTLLAQFSRQLQDSYFVVLFDITDLIEMPDVNHINILFAIAVRLLEEAQQRDVTIEKATKDALYDWLATRTHIETKEIKKEFGFGANFLKIIADKLKTDATTREKIKREFSPKVSELIARIDEIATVVQGGSGKKILVIIDGLDKLDLAVVRDIYTAHIKALFQPNVRMIFTAPISAWREISQGATMETETNNQIVTMTVPKLFPKERARQANAIPSLDIIAILEEVLNKRIPRDLLEGEIAAKMIIYSGGVLRELIRIANQCCRVCLRLIRRHPGEEIKINQEVLQEAIRKLRLDFDTRLGLTDYDMLTQIYQEFQPQDSKDPRFLDLLHGLYVLEYRNDELWYDIHPIVKELLQQKGRI